MHYRLHRGWVPNIAAALLVPTFVALGFWQLDRAEQKKALQTKYDQRANSLLRVMGDGLPAGDMQYQRVVARGHYEPRFQILIDNQVNEGQAGFQVLTPLRLNGAATRLLVNRGWVPMGPDRNHLPTAPAPAGLQEVTGMAMVPSLPTFTLGKREHAWAPLWQYLDMPRYQAVTPFPVQPFVVLLDREVTGGFVRHWRRPDTGVRIHQGYAFQWFALAIALAVLVLIVKLRKAGTTDR